MVMTEYVTCTVCGEKVGKMGIGKHADMHRREYYERFGRWPGKYEEVREHARELGRGEAETTLSDFSGDRS